MDNEDQVDIIEIFLRISGKVIGLNGIIKNHSSIDETINNLNNNSGYSLIIFNEGLECLCIMDVTELKKLYEYSTSFSIV